MTQPDVRSQHMWLESEQIWRKLIWVEAKARNIFSSQLDLAAFQKGYALSVNDELHSF